MGTLSPETVPVVVVESLCRADVILGSEFWSASEAKVCLGSVTPGLSFASGTITIRFDETKPVAANCEVSVEVPSYEASSFVPRPEPADSKEFCVDHPALGGGLGLLTHSYSSVSSECDSEPEESSDKSRSPEDESPHALLSGAEERGVGGPSLDRSYFSRLKPISFLFFNPASSSHVG